MTPDKLSLALVLLSFACSPDAGRARAAPPVAEAPGEAAPSDLGCDVERHAVGAGALLGIAHESHVVFRGGLAIDADGAPEAYHPQGAGLDHLANAGRPGRWWGLVVDEAGQPVVQGPADPAPGFFVSRTSLEDRARPERDPRRYVDADTVPYIVLPGGAQNRAWLRARGVRLGDLAVVHNERTGRTAFAIYADNGPAAHLGEGSIALARALGYEHTSPRNGGSDAAENVFLVLSGTSEGWPRTSGIEEAARARFAAWGGVERLMRCATAGE